MDAMHVLLFKTKELQSTQGCRAISWAQSTECISYVDWQFLFNKSFSFLFFRSFKSWSCSFP